MKKLLLMALASAAAVPAHAISVVSLHTGGVKTVSYATGTVSTTLIVAGIVALSAVILLRVVKHRAHGSRS